MAEASDNLMESSGDLEIVSMTNSLSEKDRIKLISLYKERPVLWDSHVDKKSSKEDKLAALNSLEEGFAFKYSSNELQAVWRSLRTSMLRECRRANERKSYISQWKFYKPLLFLKPHLERALAKADEWSDEEKRLVINFYNENHSLWNHKLHEYHDKGKRQLLLGQLVEKLDGKYSEKEVVAIWNNTKTYFDRERMREEGSKTSGTGSMKVYQSPWKFMADMRFVVAGNLEPDEPCSTIMPEEKVSRKRKRSSDDLNAKRSEMYEAAAEFMRQPQPAAPGQPPLTDEDMFGQYIASQLKLLDAHSKLKIKAQINNIFLMHQLSEFEAHNHYDHVQPQPQHYTTLW